MSHIKYASVCSGVEAPTLAWHKLGWKPMWFSEIDKFPSEVLRQRYPEVPNLGDMTKLHQHRTFNETEINLLVGGTPCQDYSIAGKRASDEGERGALIYSFLDIVSSKSPDYVVWENVPGFLSSKNNVFEKLVQGFNRLGYCVDFSILDAQDFGLAQRRKRVFLVCKNVKNGRKKRTELFLKTSLQCLIELSLKYLIEALGQYSIEGLDLNSLNRMSGDGVNTRMRLLGILSQEGQNSNEEKYLSLQSFLEDLKDTLLRLGLERKNLDCNLGFLNTGSSNIGGEKWCTPQEKADSLNILELWRILLEESLGLEKLSTISTETSLIIEERIYFFVVTLQNTLKYTHSFSLLQKPLLNSILSDLTKIERSMNCVRQPYFKENIGVEGCSNNFMDIRHRIGEIKQIVVGHIRDWRYTAAVLFDRKFLSKDIGSSNEAREDSPETSSRGPGVGSESIEECSGSSIKAYAYSKSHRENGNVDIRFTEDGKANTLTTGDGCGNQSSLNIVVHPIQYGSAAGGKSQDIHGVGLIYPYNQITNKDCRSNPKPGDPAPTLIASKQAPLYTTRSAVRRLTPIECERLQGFPDGHTNIVWEGKEAPDGHRYKAIGNSMAVPVMEWLGRRIDMVEDIINAERYL
jgi:DNA-cytosine methyltransferase